MWSCTFIFPDTFKVQYFMSAGARAQTHTHTHTAYLGAFANCKKQQLALSCLSICMSTQTTLLPLDGFSLNLTFVHF